MIEIWRDVVGYDGKYQVSNFGRVKSFRYKTVPPRILKAISNGTGYLRVCLCRNGKSKSAYVHRLVAEAFIPNPDGKPQINHINGIKTDNRAENLEWCTRSENTQHALRTGLRGYGEKHPRAKLTNEQARHIRDNPDGLTQRKLADKFGVDRTTISAIQRGKYYCDVGGKIRKPKPKAPRIPDDIREQIRAEHVPHKHGHGIRILARKYGVSQRTILKIIHEN